MPERRVLILGLDPDAIPGIDAAAVRAGLDYGLTRFEDSDLIADQCLVPLDATAERRIMEALSGEQYVVVVGGGIRKPEPLLEYAQRHKSVVQYQRAVGDEHVLKG
jgi:hypothetical protein